MLTMEEALKHSNLRFAAGEIVKGIIIEVRPKEVLVDIGYKSEGVINGGEFDDVKACKVGDEIDVLIEKLEDKEGMVVLSREKAEFKKNWERILQICNEGGIIASKPFCPLPRSTSPRQRISNSTLATRTISKSLRSIRSARTSFCHAAN